MRYFTAALLLTALSSSANAACRWVFVDHDYNAGTPAIQQQICDGALDMPTLQPIGIPPLQQIQIPPLQPLVLPPLGTTRCQNVSVYNNQTGRWENTTVCR